MAQVFNHFQVMLAYVYKSLRKADTYVYFKVKDDFSILPEAMRQQLMALQFVLEFTLTEDRKLAQENPAKVLHNLQTNGFHIQFPPSPVAPPLEMPETLHG